MKVLQVIPSYVPAYHIGGPVSAVHDLCRALARHGIEVSVFTTTIGLDQMPSPLPARNNIDGVEVTYFPASLFKKYNHAYGIARAIRREIQNYDIVHVHSVFSYTTLVACATCRENKKPYLLNPWGALDKDMINFRNRMLKMAYIKIIERNNLETASVIQVSSDYERIKIQALGFNRNIEIIPPGINFQEYSKQDDLLRARYPELKDKKIILYLGRIHPKKGIAILLKAFCKVIATRDDTYLVIAGPIDGYAKRIIRFVKDDSALNKRVIFTNMLLGSDKVAAFYSSDIFVLSSYGENFGIAALEALACGLPVILTKEVGLSADVEEYGAGLIVNQDISEISEAMERLLSDSDLRKAISLRAKSLVRSRFDLDIIADKMIGLYKNIINIKL